MYFCFILCLGEKDPGDGPGAASEADGTRAILHADTQSLALLAPRAQGSLRKDYIAMYFALYLFSYKY